MVLCMLYRLHVICFKTTTSHVFGKESLPIVDEKVIKICIIWRAGDANDARVLMWCYDVGKRCHIILCWWRALSVGKVIAKLFWIGLGGKEGGCSLWSQVSHDANGPTVWFGLFACVLVL